MEAARKRSAERLLGSIPVGPVRSTRGKDYNPTPKRFDAKTQLKMGSQEAPSSGNNSPQSTSNGGGGVGANKRNNVDGGNNSTQNGKKPEGQDSPPRNMPEDKRGSDKVPVRKGCHLDCGGRSVCLWMGRMRMYR